MPIMKWSNDLSVDIPEIDEQHKQLVALINQLHDAMSEGRGKKVLSQVLAELITYTKTHFAFEEKLMAQANYPGLDGHKIEHESLTQQVLDFQKRYESGALAVTIELSNFLRDWIVKHVCGMDKGYSTSIRKLLGLV